MHFTIVLSISAKSLVGILIGIILDLCINLGTTDIFTMLSLPIHEHIIFLYSFRYSLILSSGLYSFQHISPVDVLSDLHLNISLSLSF